MEDVPKLYPSSPFYLGSGDQPGNLISYVILKGDNYLAWSHATTLSLKSRRKFGFVDGTISKPTEKKKMLDWETVNSMLVSYILRATDPKLAASFPYFDEARKLWEYLETRFCEASGPRLQQLRAAITGCEQTKGMSVEEYFTTLMVLYDDLNRLKPPRGCECGKCECNLAALFAMDRDEERLHQFLIGNDDTKYAQVHTNLLSQQPPVTLDRAYQAFLQEERSRAIAAAKPPLPEAHVFALPNDHKPSVRIDKSMLFCIHCKRSGHHNSGCFLLHGYLDWWVEKFGKKKGREQGSGAVSAGVAAASRSLPPSLVLSSSDRAHAVLSSSVSQPSVSSYKTPSFCGAQYFLTIVDYYSRGVWVYLLHDKSEVYSSFCSFFAMVKCQFDVSVKCVRSDNGTIFKPMISWYSLSNFLCWHTTTKWAG
ncbi:Retrovirus-related Pol polyprotein from transposon TNT 1-94 [Bienertia sinuspersici]